MTRKDIIKEWAQRIGSLGGKARAKRLSPKRRHEIAKIAAQARAAKRKTKEYA